MSIENLNKYNELITSISTWDDGTKKGYAQFLVDMGDYKTLEEANNYIKRLDKRVEEMSKPQKSLEGLLRELGY